MANIEPRPEEQGIERTRQIASMAVRNLARLHQDWRESPSGFQVAMDAEWLREASQPYSLVVVSPTEIEAGFDRIAFD